MNEKGAFKRLNQLFIMVKRLKTSVSRNEQGIRPQDKRYIMEQIREINKIIR